MDEVVLHRVSEGILGRVEGILLAMSYGSDG
jgi:hypothetical protein